MNKLSKNPIGHNVVEFRALRREASVCGLVSRWQHDPATGQLRCAWTTRKGAREAQPPSRFSVAS